MTVIDSFIKSYEKEFDFYENISRTAERIIKNALSEAGIRAIVTYRAKDTEHLREKLCQRERDNKKCYQSHDDIYSDIWDLAGVRIALYFPKEYEKVERIIESNFDIISDTRVFPRDSNPPAYNKRFSGYSAHHYRVKLKTESLSQYELRYCQARIEIQVASVLMHAWSEVEHDLVYKPLNGELSEEEYAILDELNGLVLAGEIALERLQSAGNARIANRKDFNNQYELASFLYSKCQEKAKNGKEILLGNIEILYKLMKMCEIDTISALHPYLKSISVQDSNRTISAQIIDNIIAGNEDRYKKYCELRLAQKETGTDLNTALGEFFGQWIQLERLIIKLCGENEMKSKNIYSKNSLNKILNSDEMKELAEIRTFRNMVMHGATQPSVLALEEMTKKTIKICNSLKKVLEC